MVDIYKNDDEEKNRPLYSLTIGQFQQLLQESLRKKTDISGEQAIGIAALARALCCSTSQVSKLRKDGALDKAIISHIGRRIVFDVEKAREAANKWYAQKSNRQ